MRIAISIPPTFLYILLMHYMHITFYPKLFLHTLTVMLHHVRFYSRRVVQLYHLLVLFQIGVETSYAGV